VLLCDAEEQLSYGDGGQLEHSNSQYDNIDHQMSYLKNIKCLKALFSHSENRALATISSVKISY